MNKWFSLFKLSIKVLKGRNVPARIIGICSIVLIILPMVLQGVSQSLMAEVVEVKKDVYGEFTDVLYMDEAGKSMDAIRLEADDALKEAGDYTSGIVYSVLREKQDGYWINAGYADSDAISLGRIKWIQGTFPRGKQEISITRSLLEKMGLEVRLDQPIVLNGQTYQLTGIVEDYGRLWPRREKEIKSGTGAVNMFLSKEAAEEMLLTGKEALIQVLIHQKSDELIAVKTGELIQNINGQWSQADSAFRIPQGLFAMLYLCEFFIFYNVLLLSYEKTLKRCTIYSLLGMSKGDIFLCLVNELLILLLFGAWIGSALGLCAAGLVTAALNHMFSMKMHLDGLGQILSSGLFFLVIAIPCVCAFIGRILKQIYRTPPCRTYRVRTASRKYGFWRIMFSEFKQQKSICLFLVLLIAVCTAFLGYSIVYKNYFTAEASYKEYEGKMPFDYDIEFATGLRDPDTLMDESLYLDDTYERDGATDELVERLRQEDGIERVFSYKENNKVRLLLEQDQTDSYLTASDFVEDGVYEPLDQIGRIKDIFGYGDQQLVQTKLVGYNEEEIRQFEAYVAEGRIDMEKLNSGEEVILVAPPYTLEKQEDGGIRKEWCQPDVPGAYNNHLLHVGDEITLTQIESSKPYNGGVNKEALEASYRRKDKKVVIGAVLGSFVGWFENEVTIGETYYIYTTQKAFENLGMDTTYNRLRIYTEPAADYNETAEVISSYSSQLPYMQVQNLRREMETYQRLKLLIQLFCVTLLILVGMAFSFCVSGQMLFKTRLNMKKYMLLRVNGLSIRRLTGILTIQLLLLGGSGVILALPLMGAAVKMSFHMSFSAVKQYLNSWETAVIFAVFIPFFLIAAIPSVVVICRTRVKDVL